MQTGSSNGTAQLRSVRLGKIQMKKKVIITYFASRARAMIPAASGAEADVPVWESVHFDLRSVVTCEKQIR